MYQYEFIQLFCSLVTFLPVNAALSHFVKKIYISTNVKYNINSSDQCVKLSLHFGKRDVGRMQSRGRLASSLKFYFLRVRAFLRGGCFRDLIILCGCCEPRNSIELFRKQAYQRNCFANKSREVLDVDYIHIRDFTNFLLN